MLSMYDYDQGLVTDILEDMIDASKKVKRRCSNFSSSDDFLADEKSQIILDSICMQLIAIGEAVKQIDKITDKTLFVHYPEISWRNIAGVRDILSHHYFDLNAEIVFGICEDNMEQLIEVLNQINEELQQIKEK